MNARQTLRLAIVVEWVVIAVAIVVSDALASTLPDQLAAYLDEAALREAQSAIDVLGLISIGYLFLAVLASVGLLFLQRWARALYLVVTICGYLLPPYVPTVEHGITDAILGIASVMSGVILGIAYFGGIWETTHPSAKGA